MVVAGSDELTRIGDLVKRRHRISHRRDNIHDTVLEIIDPISNCLEEQVFLVPEMVVEGPLRHTGSPGDHVDSRPLIALQGKAIDSDCQKILLGFHGRTLAQSDRWGCHIKDTERSVCA
jgi:hypothetical protein